MKAVSCRGKEKLLACEHGWLGDYASGLWGRAFQAKARRPTHPQGSRRNKEFAILLKNKKKPWNCRVTIFGSQSLGRSQCYWVHEDVEWSYSELFGGLFKGKTGYLLKKNNHLPPATKNITLDKFQKSHHRSHLLLKFYLCFVKRWSNGMKSFVLLVRFILQFLLLDKNIFKNNFKHLHHICITFPQLFHENVRLYFTIKSSILTRVNFPDNIVHIRDSGYMGPTKSNL